MFKNFKRGAANELVRERKRVNPNYNIRTRSASVTSSNSVVSIDTESSSNLEPITEHITIMTQPQDIFNSLRIPDVIKDLQTFDGNPKTLLDFIKCVEEILLFIRNTDNTPYGQVLLRAVRNKIIGKANEALNNHLVPLNWDDIKKKLTDLYTDKRDESTLIRELHNLKQTSKNVIEFYNDVVDIQSLLLTNLRIRENNQATLSVKATLFNDLCLNVFLSGLKEPLGSTVRGRQPTDLSTALGICQSEEAIVKATQTNPNPFRNTYNNYNTQQHSTDIVPYKRHIQSPQNHPHPKRFIPGNKYNYPGNYQQQRNFNNYPQIKASTSDMTRQNNPRNNNQQQNRWGRRNEMKMEEINNIDEIDNNQEEEIGNIDDTQNFRTFASNNPQGT